MEAKKTSGTHESKTIGPFLLTGLSRPTPQVYDREPYCQTGVRGLLHDPHVVLCTACATLGGFLFGYDQGVISVTLVMPQFIDKFPRIALTASGAGFWKGFLTAMIELGAFLGALNQGWIADRISRRHSIVLAVFIFTLGSILQTAAANYAMLTVARLIGGIGIGMLSMVVPLYISEISPPEIRGALLVMEELSIVLGIVIAYWITYGTRSITGHWAWRLPFFLQMFPAFVLLIGVTALPFSPRWLVSKNRHAEALENLARLRSLHWTDKRVRHEFFEIVAEHRFERELRAQRHPQLQNGGRWNGIMLEIHSWIDCFRSGYRKRTWVGIGLMFFQQFVGINALIYYSPTLFASMGVDYDMQLALSGVLNITQLVGVSTSVWTMDKFGRRALLMTGSALMAISHIIIAVLVGLYDKDWPSHRGPGWTSVAFLFVYMFFFGASWGPVAWAVPSEIFPFVLRAKGVALSTCSNWLNNFIIGLITPPLVQNTGFGAYVFFAVFCVLSGIWTVLFVPETKGRTLEDMDVLFKDNVAAAAQERKRAIEAELRREDTVGDW
ncbi:putative MFS monosaccharide transporter [Talaromyces proteolyticus]|uniref:MFS monosaccharide transporter n=1 Tax=Talaromyces proteolyticus TaxID=1131652 RepID=A0AAD4Q0T3_9EURO|nr:putative MFS monosaccharide transporter [Talaromyces proteolyticus]KAH8704830.1 putative MFS monosaccharide transporter [Talaromyces proteolyticus]